MLKLVLRMDYEERKRDVKGLKDDFSSIENIELIKAYE
jgi:hypothetical protein